MGRCVWLGVAIMFGRWWSVWSAALVAGTMVSSQTSALEFSAETSDDGSRFIYVTGDFRADDDVAQFFAIALDHRPQFVTFNSPGGNVETALKLGRTIRMLNLGTVQIRNLECSSACALAFLGGVFRVAESGAIGVHRSSFSNAATMDTETAIAAIQEGTARTMAYIAEMGADPSLLQLALQYDRSDMRYLSSSEMQQYSVTLMGDADAHDPETAWVPPTPPPAPTPSAPPIARAPMPSLDIPRARSGYVRHPKGAVFLKAGPEDGSRNIANLPNRTAVAVAGTEGRWYIVHTPQGRGYLHDTWVLVDQFESGGFEDRHVQIKSFGTYPEAVAYAQQSPLRVAAYLATNGWYAITLEDTFTATRGAEVLKVLKAEGRIPDDAYMSYGNTYARKVCCD